MASSQKPVSARKRADAEHSTPDAADWSWPRAFESDNDFDQELHDEPPAFDGGMRERRLLAGPLPADDNMYDPAMPEFVQPASAEDVEERLRALRARQLRRLEAAVRRRSSSALSRTPAGILRHYSKIIQQLRSSTAGTPQSGKILCPVCLEASSPARQVLLVTLQCGHPLCSGCAIKCAGSGLSSCPVCRHPHLLDPKLLSQRKDEWRRQYSKWRGGQPRGAVGEVTSVCEPPGVPNEKKQALPDSQASKLGRMLKDSCAPDALLWAASLDRTVAHAVVTLPDVGDLAVAKLPALAREGTLVPDRAAKVCDIAPATRAETTCGCWSGIRSLFA